MKLSSSTQKFIILGVTLLAFLLRAYRLEVQSYWIEEGWTLYYANLPLSELWHQLETREPKPPFYYFSVLGWAKLMGDSEYGMRFFSLIFGVMAVPFTYRLAKALGDARLGLLAALLMAMAPYQIWHSQEARMYSILTAASAMSMWGFVKMLPHMPRFQKPGQASGPSPAWLIYIAGTEWAIMTHYHALVVIGVQGLFLLLTWRRHWRLYPAWVGTLIVIFLLYAPWLFFSSSLIQHFQHWLEQPTWWQTYVRGARAYTVGEYMPTAEAIPLVLIFVAVFMVGLIYASRRFWGAWRGPEMVAFLLAYTVAPNLAAWLYGELRTPAYFERYLIPVQVGFLLTVAMGILAIYDLGRNLPLGRFTIYASRITRFTAAITLLLLTGINGYVLWQHYFNPAYAKDDWRAVAQTIENFSLPGDAIVITGDGGEIVFNYYYQGDLPIYLDFHTPVPPEDKARDIISTIAATHRRIWYTPYGVEIDSTLEGWLAEHAYPAWHRWLGRKRLALYQSSTATTDRLESVNTIFNDSPGQGLTLLRVALSNEVTAAGDLLPLKLTWQAASSIEGNYQLSLRLINGRGDIFAQSDWPPLTPAGGTSTWPPNQPITDQRSLWLPPDIPPNNYALQLVVYNPASGQALGQPLIMPNIAVGPSPITPPLASLPIPNPIHHSPFVSRHTPLIPLGYALPDKIQPGQEMWLWLYWHLLSSSSPLKADAWGDVRISLSDNKNTITTHFSLTDSVGPLDSWQPGQVRRAVYHIPTSPQLTGPEAQVKVALVTEAGEVKAETTLARLALETRPRQFEIPAIVTPLEIVFGNSTQLKLIGYNLPASVLNPGDSLPVTLYWQAVTEMKTDYTVFVQLLDKAGQVVAQVDAPPLAGTAPTTTWLPGEILTDPYMLTLPPNLPPGSYRLITGFYNAATGKRLLAASWGDFVELSQITVK